MTSAHDPFPDRLATAMRNRGINQTELASVLGVQPSAISKLLKVGLQGLRRISDIADALDVSIDWLAGRASSSSGTSERVDQIPIREPDQVRHPRSEPQRWLPVPVGWLRSVATDQDAELVAVPDGPRWHVIDRAWPDRNVNQEIVGETLLVAARELIAAPAWSEGNLLIVPLEGSEPLRLRCPRTSRTWPQILGRVVATLGPPPAIYGLLEATPELLPDLGSEDPPVQ